MTEGLSESVIVRAVAEKAARRITRKVIATLQRMRTTLSGDDSGLKTTWDEICVQLQSEESLYWDTYDETVRSIVVVQIAALPKHEREAIWLQTDAGLDWRYEEPDKRESDPTMLDEDIVNWLSKEYVYAEAENSSNPRIRAYIERSTMRD